MSKVWPIQKTKIKLISYTVRLYVCGTILRTKPQKLSLYIKITQAIHFHISTKKNWIRRKNYARVEKNRFYSNELQHQLRWVPISKETNSFRSNCVQLLISCPIEMTKSYHFSVFVFLHIGFSPLLIWEIIHIFSRCHNWMTSGFPVCLPLSSSLSLCRHFCFLI